jgi:membrane-associated protein
VDFVNLILHIDQSLSAWSLWMGPWLYVLVFAIIFAETGFIVTPFLPGDSLLFALGAMTTLEKGGLSLPVLCLLLTAAAFFGDNINFLFGRFIGPKVFSREDSFLFNKKHLTRTQGFYEKHGVKAVLFARFLPILRTFVPFISGVAQMPHRKFIAYDSIGIIAWVNLFLLTGHFFGNLPGVKENFHYVILGIIVVSLLPVGFELLKMAFAARKSGRFQQL